MAEGPEMVVHEQHEQHERVLYAKEVFAIQGAIFEVNAQMGAGFLEAVYQECLGREFSARGIPFQADVPLSLSYKGQPLRQTYRADFVCFDRIHPGVKGARDSDLGASGSGAQLLESHRLCAPKARIERLVH
jgi:GxxExxY protein